MLTCVTIANGLPDGGMASRVWEVPYEHGEELARALRAEFGEPVFENFLTEPELLKSNEIIDSAETPPISRITP